MGMYIYDSGTPRCARHALVTKRNVCEIYPRARRRGALFSMAVASASPPPFLVRLAPICLALCAALYPFPNIPSWVTPSLLPIALAVGTMPGRTVLSDCVKSRSPSNLLKTAEKWLFLRAVVSL